MPGRAAQGRAKLGVSYLFLSCFRRHGPPDPRARASAARAPNSVCQGSHRPYTAMVKLNRNHLRLAAISALLLAGVGCSGINASHSISPASFFLPGFSAAPAAEPTNQTAAHQPLPALPGAVPIGFPSE